MDLYIVLGVQREASDAEIKRAYRRLARQLHPDINPGDREAAERFRHILNAYETLIDPERRRSYDTGQLPGTTPTANAFGFAGFDFSSAASGHRATTFGELFEEVFARRAGLGRAAPEAGADLHVKASLSFADSCRGVEWPVTVTRHDACRSCAGAGQHVTGETPCVACDGSGAVRSVRGHMVFAKPCPHCAGSGRLRHVRCETCQGLGVQPRVETVRVQIPAGVSDGARVRVAGKGHAGVRGGPPGDLYVDVAVAADPMFTRVGDDVHVSVPIAIHEAALGAKVDIPTPNGLARLRIPPGTQSGQRFRLRERGMPSVRGRPPGDLVVEVRLMLPKMLDERSKELLREFGRINAVDVRNEVRRTKNATTNEELRTER
jgi:molecular chaperone DnaJ